MMKTFTPISPGKSCEEPVRFSPFLFILLFSLSMASGLCGKEKEKQTSKVDFYSLIRITYANFLEISAARSDVDATEYQFKRFERNLSQFIPFNIVSHLDRREESISEMGERKHAIEDESRVSLGFEKEFFDGKRVSAEAGMHASTDSSGNNANPFLGAELRLPLFSSFTTLERITERNFEENEMLNAWLDFIDTIRDSISDSAESYLDLQKALNRKKIAMAAVRDYQVLLNSPSATHEERDLRQIEDQIQAFQSHAVDQDGNIESSRISLLDRLGVDTLLFEAIRPLDLYSDDYYGNEYFGEAGGELIDEAIQNDIEIQVLEIARKNALLKKSLAQRGRWDIVGKVSGTYDFRSHGDDPGDPSGYELGLGLSVQRNDPKLLFLSLRQAEAEVRKFSLRIASRERSVTNRIKRRLAEGKNLRELIGALTASRLLRRSVYERKLDFYACGEETIDNLIQSRKSLFETEKDLIESFSDFFEIVIELDNTTGFYFQQLGDLIGDFGAVHPLDS